jgi:hypothetical protein
MKMDRSLFAGAIGFSLVLGSGAQAGTVSVPGSSDPFLAGMADGSTCCGGDSAPAQSPVYAGAVTAGSTITFTAISRH